MQKPIETSEMAIPKISKTAIIVLLSFFCVGLIIVNFNWQLENEHLQQVLDRRMQVAAMKVPGRLDNDSILVEVSISIHHVFTNSSVLFRTHVRCLCRTNLFK